MPFSNSTRRCSTVSRFSSARPNRSERMRYAKARLIIALLALFAWLGYVAYQTIPYYQAKAYGRFPVISHSQLLVSNLVVMAELKADENGRPESNIHVIEV